ncbi:MAG: GTPase domain-containing protein [Gemmataceae bacterium]|nr:GTPase domain-containing protein [Gemmataceae bacterium]
MDTLSPRALVGQLADDLDWLERHARRQPDPGRLAGLLRLASAVARNVIGPALDGQEPSPLHVVVVGGAGAGKSTVSNFLSGSSASEANPQAGFTRHPIAFTSMVGPINWAAHLGFLGPLTRLTTPAPSSLDQDVYQVRRVPADPGGIDLLADWVVWDCPDMTTWAAEGYVNRLIEAAGLADVVVYAASDERYNDEIPTEFLRMLLEAGKPVVCCLLKMKEADAPALIEHFKKEVAAKMPPGVVGVLPIPHLSPAQLADPLKQAAKFRIPLLNQVAVFGGKPAATRARTVQGATRFLVLQQQRFLDVARSDVQALEAWSGLVRSGQEEFEARYQREYLATEKFRGFDEALMRLMQLLELPGVGQIVSGTLAAVRYPFQLLGGWLFKAVARPDAPTRLEQPILEESFAAWLDTSHKEAGRRASEHPLWSHIAAGFRNGHLAGSARERFAASYRDFQASYAAEVDRTARSIYEHLERKPVLLNSLRTSKLGLEVAAIGGTILTGGLGWNLLLVPVIASVTHQLVEMLGRGVVDAEREATRKRMAGVLRSSMSGPLADWLAGWPASGDSPFGRLQLALRRLPQSIAALDSRVRAHR